MEITESQLTSQYQHANSTWPFIRQTEISRGLPRMLLFAIGSRETNLTNEVGDFGHGHGVWQLDDRFHAPPGGSWSQFDANVAVQCATAAAMLQGMLTTTGGKVEEAAAIYNSGQQGEPGTTHGNYGIDVLQRMQFLQQLSSSSVIQPNTPPWYNRDLGLASPFMAGDDVKVVQKKTGAAPDGLFGPVTQAHVITFQSQHGLTADGIVGALTASVLGS